MRGRRSRREKVFKVFELSHRVWKTIKETRRSSLRTFFSSEDRSSEGDSLLKLEALIHLPLSVASCAGCLIEFLEIATYYITDARSIDSLNRNLSVRVANNGNLFCSHFRNIGRRDVDPCAMWSTLAVSEMLLIAYIWISEFIFFTCLIIKKYIDLLTCTNSKMHTDLTI